MNQKEKRQLDYVEDAIRGHMRVQDLCHKLGVSSGGLGHRIIALKRKEYLKTIKNDV